LQTSQKYNNKVCNKNKYQIFCLPLYFVFFYGFGKGRYHRKKHVFFRALPEKGGGVTHARIFWPFFHQEKVPKIGTFLLKTNDICMFFVIIIIKITIITNVIIIKTIIIINGIFFCHTRKTSF